MLALLQASVIVYVLVTTTGQVPAEETLLVTTSEPSTVHASVIVIPPASPSRPATVVSAADTVPTTAEDAASSVISSLDRTYSREDVVKIAAWIAYLSTQD